MKRFLELLFCSLIPFLSTLVSAENMLSYTDMIAKVDEHIQENYPPDKYQYDTIIILNNDTQKLHAVTQLSYQTEDGIKKIFLDCNQEEVSDAVDCVPTESPKKDDLEGINLAFYQSSDSEDVLFNK